MTHSEDEEETRHLFGLPDSAISVIGVHGDINDSWYKWNQANSFAVNRTDGSDASLVEAT